MYKKNKNKTLKPTTKTISVAEVKSKYLFKKSDIKLSIVQQIKVLYFITPSALQFAGPKRKHLCPLNFDLLFSKEIKSMVVSS